MLEIEDILMIELMYGCDTEMNDLEEHYIGEKERLNEILYLMILKQLWIIIIYLHQLG
jgi:hypothetical protein